MKYYKFIFLFLVVNSLCSAQVFEVDTLRWSGEIDKKINLVILGDGYVESEIGKLVTDAKSFSNEMFSQTPFKEYENYFNTFLIKVISNESGVSHPGTATDVTEPQHQVSQVDNFFGTPFDGYGIHRLVVPTHSNKIYNVLANNFPLYDHVIILANANYSGGSGGFFAVSTTETSANEIAIHELGHSFADLADEYYAGDNYSAERANMTKETDPDLVKWKNWMDDSGIGVYRHCCGGQSSVWYRPHQDCKMRFLGAPFCVVCTQQIIESIHELVSPLNEFSPDNNISTPTFPIHLKLDLTHPSSHSVHTRWRVNGRTIAQNKDSVIIEFDDLEVGENEVSAFIEDKSDFLRVDEHNSIHFQLVNWNISKSLTDIDTDIRVEEGSIQIYPNPVLNKFTISGKLNLFQIEVINPSGKVFQTIDNAVNQYTLDVSDLPSGQYFIRVLSKNNNLLQTQQIIKE